MGRGTLRIYLGASPGVGKTFAMLNEGFRTRDRGRDVVVGIVETHGRAATLAQIRDLEVIPRRKIEYRGAVLEEMDVDAILARRPQLVLVDELAHTNAPGSRHEKRWQDIEQLLDAGISVISTLNIQHLESLNDVIARITGITQRETVPDAVVRRADQIELVDMTPEAIRRRMAHGNIYPPERIDAALSNYFRPGNLGALRELALLWVADRVEEALTSYLADHGITDAWETRERVVVGLTGRPGGEVLIRRAARMAGRLKGDLIGVHVVAGDGLADDRGPDLLAQRKLIAELGGAVHEVVGAGKAESLIAFARTEKATQLVLGASRRSRWYELLHGSFVAKVTRLAGGMDVHVIAHDPSADDELLGGPRPVHPPTSTRHLVAWALTVVGLPLLTFLLAQVREHVVLSTELLTFLSLVLVISAIGGRVVAAVAAIASSLLVNWYFVPPIHTFTIDQAENIVALAVFLAVALTVGSLVDAVTRRAVEASRARAEAEALARSAARLAADPDPLPALVEQVRVTFGLDCVRITHDEGGTSVAIAESGSLGAGVPTIVVPFDVVGALDGPHRLEAYGRPLSTDDQRLLRVLADQLAVAIEAQRLGREAATAESLAEVDAVRTALLRAVSHDLRSPLASIKAMVSGLRDGSVPWTQAQVAEALTTVDEETDRLNRLVGNLLDASRLQIGALAVQLRDASVIEPIDAALHSLDVPSGGVVLDVPEDLPPVECDVALLERALANIVANALRYSSAPGSVRITAGLVGDRVHVCVIDRGPGIAAEQRDQVLAPFQRLGDQQTADGVGLGLAIAQGFVQSMDGTLTLDDTPGGGLTVTVALPLAPRPSEVVTP